MDALELIDQYQCTMTVSEIKKLCVKIRKASGDRVMAIFTAKIGGWWDQNNNDTCKEILRSRGSIDIVLPVAKRHRWWIDPPVE